MTTETALDKLNRVLADLESVIGFVEDAKFETLDEPLKKANEIVEQVRDTLADSQLKKC